jgi:hypothetical protein
MKLRTTRGLEAVGCVDGILYLRKIGHALGLNNNDTVTLVKDNTDMVSVYNGHKKGHGVTFEEAGRMDQWDLGNLSDRKKMAIRDFAATFRRVNRALAGGSPVAEEIHVMSDAEAAAIHIKAFLIGWERSYERNPQKGLLDWMGTFLWEKSTKRPSWLDGNVPVGRNPQKGLLGWMGTFL